MTTTAPNETAKPLRRMTLANIRSGKLDTAKRILLYGVEGVGKSTFAARAPKPIFIGADAGTENLAIDRLPEPQRWSDVFEGVQLLQNEKHEFETLVVDPVNFLEPLCWQHLCEKHKWDSIEDPGFGKGYDEAFGEWRKLVAELERLWSSRRMNIILLGHTRVKLFKNPEGEDFERYTLPMHEKAAGLLRQWCSFVLFAKHNFAAKKDEKTKRVRGVTDGTRVLHTTWHVAYDAKNRSDLPPELPLSWDGFIEAVNASKEREATLRQQIADGVRELADPVITKQVEGYLRDAGDDVARIAELANAVAMKVNEKAAAMSATATETTATGAASAA